LLYKGFGAALDAAYAMLVTLCNITGLQKQLKGLKMGRENNRKEDYQFGIFEMLYDNWERIERGEVELLAEDIAERFDITVERARTRITNYYYNRMMQKPVRGFEADGKITITYLSKV
jgi:hypothetical protein